MTETPNNDVQEGKFFAAISYISFFCIVTLVLKRENKFALYHAKHGLVLFLGEVACFILKVIPFFGNFINITGFVVFSLIALYGILQSLIGKYSRIPVITDIADKISL